MNKVLDIIYLSTSIVGAALVATNIGAQLIGYSLFLVSSVVAVFLLLKSNASRSLLVVNIMFALINVVGIIRS